MKDKTSPLMRNVIFPSFRREPLLKDSLRGQWHRKLNWFSWVLVGGFTFIWVLIMYFQMTCFINLPMSKAYMNMHLWFQLFLIILRSVGVPARLVYSLQPVSHKCSTLVSLHATWNCCLALNYWHQLCILAILMWINYALDIAKKNMIVTT